MKLITIWLLMSITDVPGQGVILERHTSREVCDQAMVTRHIMNEPPTRCEPIKSVLIEKPPVKDFVGPVKP